VVQGKTQGKLRAGIAIDLHIAALPAAYPGRLVRLDHPPPTQALRSVQAIPGFLGGVHIFAITTHDGNEPLKADHLPGAGFPGPRRYQRSNGGGRNIPIVNLQRCHGCHRQVLPRMRGVPKTQVLTDPIGNEPEFRPFKRRLESHIELAVFDLHPDQLHPDRAVTQRYETTGMHMQSQVRRLQLTPFTAQSAPPQIKCHAMRRHIAGMMQQGTVRQHDTHPQPVRGRDKTLCGLV
jgi:hypothetical protein